MKFQRYRCDGCQAMYDGDPPATLTGNWSSKGGGILLPRLDYDFCSDKCLRDWLANARLNNSSRKIE